LIDKADESWSRNNYLSGRALAEAENIRSQLQRIMERMDIDLVSHQDETKLFLNVRKALVCGFFMQAAHKEHGPGSYLTVKDNQVQYLVNRLTLPLNYSCRLLGYIPLVDSRLNRNGSFSMNLF
jgi:hypothetical protein